MPTPEPDSLHRTDDDLLNRARKGDENSFLLLFDRHRDVIFRLAYRLTDAHAAEDITQECLLSLLAGPNHYDPAKGSLRTYLYGAVRNLGRRHYWLHHGDVDLDESLDDAAFVVEPIAHRQLVQNEVTELVQDAVASLPIAQREAFVLSYFEELPLDEIAQILAVEVGTVKSRLHRARERLRRSLSPHFERRTLHEPIR